MAKDGWAKLKKTVDTLVAEALANAPEDLAHDDLRTTLWGRGIGAAVELAISKVHAGGSKEWKASYNALHAHYTDTLKAKLAARSKKKPKRAAKKKK